MLLQRKNVERESENPVEIRKLISAGFSPVEKETIETVENEEVNLEEMTLHQLKDIAKEKGINGYSVLNKEDLIKVLKDVVE